MAAHLRLLEAVRSTPAQTLLAGVLIGPAQVVARLTDAIALKRSHPLLSARVAATLHPAGVALLALGTGAIPAFAFLPGARVTASLR